MSLPAPHWITSPDWLVDPDGPLPVLARRFTATGRPRSVVLQLTGVGVWRATVNGEPVSRYVLEPGYADWARLAETVEVDISPLVRPGDNLIMIELGPGLYRSQPPPDGPHEGRWTKVVTDFGDLAAHVNLAWTDDAGEHRVVSDDTWRATTGAVVAANFVGGEDHDLTRALDPAQFASWPRAVTTTRVPDSRRPRSGVPLVVRESLPAVTVTEPVPGSWVIDFGVNAAGWPVLDLPADSEVRLRPAELLHPDGTIDSRTQGWGPVFHTVRTAGATTWHPTFGYNGLRYLEVTGLDTPPGNARLDVIAADVADAGSFSCSSERLTAIHTIIRRAVISNLSSLPTDCPQREKLNYLEQLHLAFDVMRWNFDVHHLLCHTMEVVTGSMGSDGHLGLYAPEWQPNPDPWRGDANWGLAVVFTPWLIHRAYGDVQVLADTVDDQRRHLDHLSGTTEDGLLVYGLGDWNGRRPVRWVPLVCTSALARGWDVHADTLAVLGQHPGAAEARQRAEAVRERVRQAFVRETDEGLVVGDDSIAETFIAIDSGVLPDSPSLVDRLARRIAEAGHVLDVGEVALGPLVDVLARHDHHETLWQVCQVTDEPSYGYMLAHGATALTETWDGPTFGFSQNHFMNGAIEDWFFAHVAGLQQAPGGIGWRDVVIRPRPCGDLTHAEATHRTPQGTLQVTWSRDAAFSMSVEIPSDTTAEVVLPGGARHRVGPGRHEWREPA
ncbi:family 78 glycoside hydrolase catalytic domain [Microlunatus sp. Y2014]|uniref:family 78 glycoside hydrolase catalytic domain n=1 Tax=Microlunatus sp. Y2014 TaxID=3418488 RepID=UPI003DA6FAC9